MCGLALPSRHPNVTAYCRVEKKRGSRDQTFHRRPGVLVRALAGLLVGSDSEGAKDVEILVLRHQLTVLRRKTARPKLKPLDRVILAVASRALPRDR
jgi:hypothetical protein